MCKNNDLLQRQKLEEQNVFKTKNEELHENVPQNINLHHVEEPVNNELEFEQPQHIVGLAPAPELPVEPQQVRLNWFQRMKIKYQNYKERKNRENAAKRAEKERIKAEKAAEKQRKAEEKARQEAIKKRAKEDADAKKLIDKLFAEMKANPIPGEDSTDYNSVRPTELYSPRAEYLLRVILDKVKNIDAAQELYDEVTMFTELAHNYDKTNHDFRFRTLCVPLYIEEVLKKPVPKAVTRVLNKEAVEYSDMSYYKTPLKKFEELKAKIYSHLSEEEVKEIEKSDYKKGVGVQEYKQDIQTIMTEKQIDEQTAIKMYADKKMKEKRVPTLRKLEEQRKDFDKSQSYLTYEEASQYMTWIKEDIARMYPNEPVPTEEQLKQITTDYLRKAMKDVSYQIRVPNCDIMQKIIANGRFKTQMETQSSRAALDLEQRKNFTKNSFGVDTDTLPPEEYEVYGYASHGDLVKESSPDSRVGMGCEQYGQVIVTLKKDAMKHRVTTSVGDSLSNQMNARVAMVDRPDFISVGGKHRLETMTAAYKHFHDNPSAPIDFEEFVGDVGVPYVELQYHGGVKMEDIESVTLISNLKTSDIEDADVDMPEELVNSLKQLGIKAIVVKDGVANEL